MDSVGYYRIAKWDQIHFSRILVGFLSGNGFMGFLLIYRALITWITDESLRPGLLLYNNEKLYGTSVLKDNLALHSNLMF